MPALQHRITAADILSDAEYNARRAELRAASIADKKNRRIDPGQFFNLAAHFAHRRADSNKCRI